MTRPLISSDGLNACEDVYFFFCFFIPLSIAAEEKFPADLSECIKKKKDGLMANR